MKRIPLKKKVSFPSNAVYWCYGTLLRACPPFQDGWTRSSSCWKCCCWRLSCKGLSGCCPCSYHVTLPLAPWFPDHMCFLECYCLLSVLEASSGSRKTWPISVLSAPAQSCPEPALSLTELPRIEFTETLYLGDTTNTVCELGDRQNSERASVLRWSPLLHTCSVVRQTSLTEHRLGDRNKTAEH